MPVPIPDKKWRGHSQKPHLRLTKHNYIIGYIGFGRHTHISLIIKKLSSFSKQLSTTMDQHKYGITYIHLETEKKCKLTKQFYLGIRKSKKAESS
jgi:hypothetical protein